MCWKVSLDAMTCDHQAVLTRDISRHLLSCAENTTFVKYPIFVVRWLPFFLDKPIMIYLSSKIDYAHHGVQGLVMNLAHRCSTTRRPCAASQLEESRI